MTEIELAPSTKESGDWTAEQIATARAAVFAEIEQQTRQDRARREAERHEYPAPRRKGE